MNSLSITLIDVGWGDSILIDSQKNNHHYYALIDSNDTTYNKSSFQFLKKYFERNNPDVLSEKHIFDFIILSHSHLDHGQGLKHIMREFGTKYFWYPKSLSWGSLSYLISYCNRSNNVKFHQSIDVSKIIPKLGDVEISVLWPQYNQIDRNNENNNSIVLCLTLGNVSIVLTGDAEEEVWDNIANSIPHNTKFFKLPHHGSKNGTFDQTGNSAWFTSCPNDCIFGISSHVRPFSHPDFEVIELLKNNNRTYYRTDEQYHLTISTDEHNLTSKYSH